MSESIPSVARQIMATRLITLRPEQQIDEAIDLLLDNRISGAPVVDAAGKLVGLLSEKDCISLLANATMYNTPSATTVDDLMTRSVVTIYDDTDLLTIAGLFMAHSYRRLPVIDHAGELVGQVSRRDVLRGIQRIRRAARHQETERGSVTHPAGYQQP